MTEVGEAVSQPRIPRVILEVVAGLVPGKDPDPKYTRRWVIYSDEWHAADADGRVRLLMDAGGAAQAYALLLQNPAMVNWVRNEWIYL